MTAVKPPAAFATSYSLDDFQQAWDLFIRAVAAVARVRGAANSVIDAWVERLLEPSLELARGKEMSDAFRAMNESPVERRLLANLTEEMWFYVWAYRSVSPELPTQIPLTFTSQLSKVSRDPQGDEAVEDTEVIMGSVEKLIDKLPGPLKKFMHAFLEILKLTRGLT